LNGDFLSKITILIVEDSATDRKILVDVLKNYFQNVLEASDGEEGYKVYKENSDIDIIISDLNMPKLSGINFLKLVRTSDMNIPFIVTTGKIDPEVMLEAIDLNVNSYIKKPIDLRVLLQKIDFLCEKKYLQNGLENKRKEIEHLLEAVDVAALIFRMNEKGDISYMNGSMLEVSGYEEAEIGTLNFNDIIHPDIPRKYIDSTWEELKEGNLCKRNTKFISKNKGIFYLNNTIYKTDEDEFTTVAFLTTKENLDQRDFKRKVILKFQESNRKEFKLKQTKDDLEIKLEKLKNLYLEDQISIKRLQEKNALNVRQLKHYEIQGDNLTQKYEKFMNSKKDEIESYIKNLNIEKNKNEQLTLKLEDITKLFESLKARNEYLEEEVRSKNVKINSLIEVIDNGKKEITQKKGLSKILGR